MRFLIFMMIIISCGSPSSKDQGNKNPSPVSPTNTGTKTCSQKLIEENIEKIRTLADVAEFSFKVTKDCQISISEVAREFDDLKGVQDE